jgi:hypothetical protein
MNGRKILGFLAVGSVALTLLNWSAPTYADDSGPNKSEDSGPSKPEDGRPALAEDIGDFVTILKGFAISPVKLDLKGKNSALVGLGSYIVNAQGGCNDCHTSPPYAAGGDPFKGEPVQINQAAYLAGGMTFGPFVSRNLTPDDSGRPAGLTLDQFFEVMRHGTDFKDGPPPGTTLLQVMPWPVYANMRDIDLRAIYEYLKAIPHADTPPPTP